MEHALLVAQLDLKKAVYKMSHDSIALMLRRKKNLSAQQIAALCTCWSLSSLEVRLGHVVTDHHMSVEEACHRELPEAL